MCICKKEFREGKERMKKEGRREERKYRKGKERRKESTAN